jgi:hypothetical protein
LRLPLSQAHSISGGMMTSEQTPPPAQPAPPARPVFTVEELNRYVPGMGTLMPEIGTRTWKLYYAAKALNWTMANFQLAEITGLMRTGATTRPQYADDLNSFSAEFLQKLRDGVRAQDFAQFDSAFQEVVSMANEFHEGVGRDYIVWKLPDYPPPDLDMTPRGGS